MFFQMFRKFCFADCWPLNKHENPPLTNPLENPDPWDHAQMIERKILFRIALTRALYDQIRPYFFLKIRFLIWPPQYLFVLRSLNYLFAKFWHLFKSCKNRSPMVREFCFVKCKLFFSRIFDPPEKHENPPWTTPPWNPRTLGPCPDDRAQHSVQDSLNESSVRPDPTLVFFKNTIPTFTEKFKLFV